MHTQIDPEGRLWRATVHDTPWGRSQSPALTLARLEEWLLERYDLAGEAFCGSQAEDLLESAREVEAAERRGKAAETMAGRFSRREVLELEAANRMARSPEVLRG